MYFFIDTEPSISENRMNFTYEVMYQNRAPVITQTELTLPSITEDTTNNQGIQVHQLAAMIGRDNDTPTLGLAVIQLDQTNGVWQYTSGVDSSWVAFPDSIPTGSALQLNSSSRIRFIPREDYFGESQLTTHVWDMTNNDTSNILTNINETDTFTGAFSSSTARVIIVVTHVNDPSEIFLNITEVVYTEASPGTQIFPQLLIIDIDNSNLQSASIILDCPGCAPEESLGDEILSRSTMLVFRFDQVSNQSSRREFLITPIAPADRDIARFTEYLQSLYFANNDLEPVIQPRTVTLSVNDGTNSSNAVSVTVSINLVNDETPSITLPFDSFTYTENSGRMQVFSSTMSPTVADLDQIYPLSSATVQLIGADLDSESIMVNCTAYPQLICTYSNGALNITGSASAPMYNEVLGSLSYENSDEEPAIMSRMITFTVSDGMFDSPQVSLMLLIQHINDQLPIISPGNSTVVFTEGNPTSSPVVVASTLTVLDPDIGAFPVATIQAILVDPVDEGSERIDFRRGFNFPPFVVVNTSDPNRVMLSVREGSVNMNGLPITGLPPNVVQSFLQNLRYLNQAVQPSGESRTIMIVVSDNFTLTGLQDSDPAVITVLFQLVDDLPEVELNALVVLYSEGQTPSQIILAPNAEVNDVDNDNISGITIELTSQAENSLSEEVLQVNLPQDGSIMIEDVLNRQYINLTGIAPLQVYRSVLRTLSYEHLVQSGDPDSGNRLVRVTPISESGQMGVADEVTIALAAVNNPPILDLNGNASGRNFLTVFEEGGQPIYVTSREALLRDVDSTELTFVQITLFAGGGTNMEAISINSTISTSITIEQSSTTSILLLGRPSPIEEFLSLLLALQYVNREDEPSPEVRTVTIVANDGNGQTEQNTTITIQLINDPPVVFLNGNEMNSRVTYIEEGISVVLGTNPRIIDADSGLIELRVRPEQSLPGDVILASRNLYFDSAMGYYFTNFSSYSTTSVEQLISSVVFMSNLSEPNAGDRVFCFSVLDDQRLSSREACSRVSVTFVNDNLPSFQLLVYQALVGENIPNEDVIQVMATDDDSVNTPVVLTYSIISGDDCISESVFTSSGMSGSGVLMEESTTSSFLPCRFMINASSGQISTTDSPPDREQRSSYSLTVAASDGVFEGRAIVNVTINDVIDVAPRFQPVSYSATIPLGAQVNYTLALISVVDPDDDIVEIFLMEQNPTRIGVFEVEPSGRVFLMIPENQLDTEVSRYVLTFNAIDSGGNDASNMATLTVNVILNNAAPIFEAPNYTMSVLEDISVRSTVVKASAMDADTGSNAEITYSIEPSTSAPPFTINSTTGDIVLTSSLDFESIQNYVFTIIATDNGRPKRSGTATVFIQVLNANEFRPSFNQTSYSIPVCEGTPVGYEILRLSAEDGDAGSLGEVRYMVVDEQNSLGRITVNESTGSVTVTTPLDFEQQFRDFIINVQAMDGGGHISSEVQVMVSLQNDNEFPPVFQMMVFEVTVPENYPVSNPLPLIEVSQSIASDSDACDVDQCRGSSVINTNPCTSSSGIMYRIANGNEAGLFAINPTTGIISLVRNLDFDVSGHRSFSLVLVADDGEFNSSAVLEVTVTDSNDNLPVFENSSYSVTIPEDTELGIGIITVMATDIDPTSVILYSLIGERSQDFTINNVSGVVSVARGLNFQVMSEYNLIVVAQNPSPAVGNTTYVAVPLTVAVTDVNDNPPVFSMSSYMIPLQENSEPGIIGRVMASDLDSGSNAEITYSITAITPGNSSFFYINASSGVLSARFSFDREQMDRYTLTVQARDNGLVPLSASVQFVVVILDENDNPPLLMPDSYVARIGEDTPLETRIVTINATDPDDLEARLLFQITAGDGLQQFAIDEAGAIYVARQLDRESIENYTLTVSVSDLTESPRTSLANVYISLNDVNDNPPSFSSQIFTASIPEIVLATPPYFIIDINATDRDINSNAVIIYSFRNNSAAFEIHPVSGVVTVKDSSRLDRETMSSYNLEVVATNPDGLSSSALLQVTVLDVNDNLPVFTQSTYSSSIREDFTPLSEDCLNLIIPVSQLREGGGNSSSSGMEGGSGMASGSGMQSGSEMGIGTTMSRYITTITATDRDQPNTPNSRIVYSLVSVSPPANFTIDSSTGDLHINQILDRECFGSYHLVVRASDSSESLPLSSTANVNVTVTDINDNAPSFQQTVYNVSILESATSLLQVVAIDPDSGINAEVVYSLGPGSAPFNIERSSGRIYASSSLDRETISSYNFEVFVQDNGRPPQSASALMMVTVLDANDNSPILSPSGLTRTVDENLPVGTTITTFSVTDADIGVNTVSNITLEGQSSSFSIIDGVLMVSGPLDFETNPVFSFRVIARNVEPPHSLAVGIAEVQIVLNNLNDNPPIVTFNNPRVDYFERTKRLELNVGASIIDDDGRNFTTLVDGIVEFYNVDPREPSAAFIPNTKDPFLPYDCPLEDEKERKFAPCNLPVMDDNFFTQPSLDLMVRNLDANDITSNTIVFDASREQHAYMSVDDNLVQTGLTISTWIWFEPVEGGSSPLTIVSKASPDFLLYSLYCSPDGQDLGFQYRDGTGEKQISFPGACLQLQGAWNHLGVVLDNSNTPQWDVVVYINAERYGVHTISPPIDADGSIFVGTTPNGGVNAPRRHFFNGRLHLLLFSYSVANQNEINCAIGCGVAIISTLETTPLSYRYNYTTRALNIVGRQSIDIYEELLNSFAVVLPLIEPVSSLYSVNFTVQDDVFNCIPNGIIIDLHPMNDFAPSFSLSFQGSEGDTNITSTNFTTTFVEEGGPVSVLNRSSFLLTDRDLVAFTYTITVVIEDPQPQGSNEVLNVTNYPSSMNVTFSDYTLTITGIFPLPVFRSVLETITYNNLDDEPIGESRLLRFTVSDPPEDDVVAFTSVDIDLVNDVPAISIEFRVTEYSEDNGAVQFIRSVIIDDSDNSTLVAGQITFNIFDLGAEILSVDTSNTNITSLYNNVTGVLMLMGEDTLANYDAVFQSLSYEHTNMRDPSPGTRVFDITVSDGLSMSSSSVPAAMLFFSSINDPPVIDLNGPSVGLNYITNFAEDSDTSISAVSPLATLIDVDNTTLVNISITLSPRPDGNDETLIITTRQLEGTAIQLTGPVLVLSMENNILPTIDNLQTILRSLQYQNLAEEPTLGIRTIEFIAHDGIDAGLPVTSQVTIQATNDVPMLDIDTLSSGTRYQTSFMEHGAPVFITSRNVSVIDNDNNASISTIMIVIQNALDGSDERIISMNPFINISILPSSSSISFMISPLDDSLAAVEELLTTLQYVNSREEPSVQTRIISISVSDGTSFSNSELVTLLVNSLNENAPRFLQPQYSRSILEELAPEVNITTVRAIDQDSGPDGDISYRIVGSVSPQGESHFRIDNSGAVFATVALDREAIEFYSLNISASDNGNPPRIDYAVVEITVLDINDQSPVFPPGTSFDLSIVEGSPVGASIATVEATDRDLGQNAVVTYSLSGESSLFNVLSNGRIEVAGGLDADVSNPIHVITVIASDNGTIPLATEANFTITIQDINDNNPQFNATRYRGEIIENAPPGTFVVAATATDRDSGTNGQLSYTLETFTDPPRSCPFFSIEDGSGIITSTISFDRESGNVQTLCVVRARDNGLPSRTNQGIVTVFITVTDDNDNQPEFSMSNYVAAIDESIAVGSSVLRVTATDRDEGTNALFSYSIIPNTQNMPLFASDPFFTINSTTGEIFVNQTVDFELQPVISFGVQAVDMGNSPLTGQASVTISLRDLNDNAPQFNESFYQVSIPENVTIGTIILEVMASDADSNQNGDVLYTLHDSSNTFTINQITGAITNRVLLDFESDCFYRFAVTASDNGLPSLNSTALIQVTILPVHDVPPVFSMSSYSVSVVENSRTGSSIQQILATDGDETSCAEIDTVTSGSGAPDLFPTPEVPVTNFEYILLNHNDVFAINNETGLITNLIVLDREVASRYVVRVQARDPVGLTAEASLTVNVLDQNDNFPMFTQPSYTTIVSENAAIGTTILQVIATDADSVDQGRLIYSLRQQRDFFAINNRTGILYISGPVDFDTLGSLVSFVAVVTDTAANEAAAIINLIITDLNDIPPTIITPPIMLTFTEGDFSLRPFPQISINDSDSFQLLCSATVTLSTPQNRNTEMECGCLTNAEVPMCTQGCFEFLQVPVGSFPGSVIQSENGTMLTLVGNYSIMTYVSAIQSIQYVNLISNPVPQSRMISVYVFDCLLPSNTLINTINVEALNIFPPIVDLNGPADGNDFNITFRERGPQVAIASPDAVITDADTVRMREELTGVDVWITNPQDGNGESLAISSNFSHATIMFTRNSAHNISFSGVALLSDYVTILRQISYENRQDEPNPTPPRTVNVIAHEYHLSSNPAMTIIEFISSNDHPPVIETSPPQENRVTSFREGGAGIALTSSNAFIADRDLSNDPIRKLEVHTVTPSQYDRIFLLDTVTIAPSITVNRASNSSITFSGVASRSEYDIIIRGLMYQFTGNEFEALFPPKFVYLQVEDSVFSTFSAVQITFVPVNDQLPIFTQSSFTAEVPENASVGYSIIQVTATDGDRFSENNIEFSIQAGNSENFFVISPENGTIYTNRPLDHEMSQVHRLIVAVTDHSFMGTPPAAPSTATVTINIRDVNDLVPMFSTPEYNATVGESVPIGTVVLRVFASDGDSPQHSQLEFELAGSTDFAINRLTGVISTNAEIDRERTPLYILLVIVRNPGISAFDTARVNITVLDLDDNPPVITLDPNSITLQEPDTSVPLAVNLDITDLDPNPSLDYALVQILSLSNSTAPGELISFVESPTITVSGNGSSMLVLMGESQPLSEFTAILRGVVYQDLANEPEDVSRMIAYQVGSNPVMGQPLQLQDGNGETTSNISIFTVMIDLINDNPPQLALDSRPQGMKDLILPPCASVSGSYSIEYIEDAGPISVSHSSLMISDADSGVNAIAYAVIEITNPQDEGLERLLINLPASSPVSVSSGNATNRIVLRGPASLREYENALRAVM